EIRSRVAFLEHVATLSMTELSPATNSTAADWIVSALTTFGESVHSLVPEGFTAYVRVFHPAYRLDLAAPRPWNSRKSVPWVEIARSNGTIDHPGMQLASLTGSFRFMREGQPAVYEHAPREGSIPSEVGQALVSVLSRHTATPDDCWIAVWNGFGRTRDDIRQAPTFRVPARDYFLLHGAVRDGVMNVLDYGDSDGQTPNIWWPDDHAWCVATEIDLNTTYIGCSAACRDELLSTPELEALAIDPTIGISWTSDTMNPIPPRGA
ncbi:MAG: hypothetical protein ABUS54_10020, partial [Actinomycetota bacterium]